MSKAIINEDSLVALSQEALEALGVETGAELQLDIVGRALIVRSVEEAQRSCEFMNTFNSVLTERRAAFEELAKGPE